MSGRTKLRRFCVLLAFACCLPALLWASGGAGIDEGLAAYGRGDFRAALQTLMPLAQSGDAAAQFCIGKMFDNGQGVGCDYQRAFNWYRKSAAGGYAPAQFALGMILHCGLNGARRDSRRGLKWLDRAARQGHALAMVNLAVAYYNGEGIRKDPVMVYVWSSVAAAHGNGQARHFRDKIKPKLSAGELRRAKEMIGQWRFGAKGQ